MEVHRPLVYSTVTTAGNCWGVSVSSTVLLAALLLAGCAAPAEPVTVAPGTSEPIQPAEPGTPAEASSPGPWRVAWEGEVTLGLPSGLAVASHGQDLDFPGGNLTVTVTDAGGTGLGGWSVQVQQDGRVVAQGTAPLTADLPAGTYRAIVTTQAEGLAVKRQFTAEAQT